MTLFYVLLALAAVADAASTQYVIRRGGYEMNPVYGKRPKLVRMLAIKAVIGCAIAAVWHAYHPLPQWMHWLPIGLWFAAALWNVRVARKLR